MMIRRWKISTRKLRIARVFIRPYMKSVWGVAMKSSISEYLFIYDPTIALVKRWGSIITYSILPKSCVWIPELNQIELYTDDDERMTVTVFRDIANHKFLSCRAAVASEVEIQTGQPKKVKARSVVTLLDDAETNLIIWSAKLFERDTADLIVSFATFMKEANSLDAVVESTLTEETISTIRWNLRTNKDKKYLEYLLQAVLMSVGMALGKLYPEYHLSRDIKELVKIFNIFL